MNFNYTSMKQNTCTPGELAALLEMKRGRSGWLFHCGTTTYWSASWFAIKRQRDLCIKNAQVFDANGEITYQYWMMPTDIEKITDEEAFHKWDDVISPEEIIDDAFQSEISAVKAASQDLMTAIANHAPTPQ